MKLALPALLHGSLDFLYSRVFDAIAITNDPGVRERLAEKAMEYEMRVVAVRASGISPGHADALKLWDSLCKQGVAQDVLARGRTRRGLARERCLSLVEKVVAESNATSSALEILDLPRSIRPPLTMFENAYLVIQKYVQNRDRSRVYGGTGF